MPLAPLVKLDATTVDFLRSSCTMVDGMFHYTAFFSPFVYVRTSEPLYFEQRNIDTLTKQQRLDLGIDKPDPPQPSVTMEQLIGFIKKLATYPKKMKCGMGPCHMEYQVPASFVQNMLNQLQRS